MNRRVKTRPTGASATRPTRRPQVQALLVRNLRRLGMGLLVVSLPLVALQLWLLLDRPVREVVLSGEFPAGAEASLQQQLWPLPAGGVLSMDLDQIRARAESQSWVQSATVRRQWPSRLIVSVQQHEVVARWNREYYLNPLGEKVRPWVEIDNLPELASAPGQEARILQQYQLLERALDQAGLVLVGATMDSNDNLELNLQRGVTIQLGNKDLLPRLQRVLMVWNQSLQGRAAQVESIDARYGSGIAVRWKTEQAALAQR